MSDNYLSLSYGQLAISFLLILINVALSLRLRLGLERPLLIASIRMVVQLLLIGYVLEWLFALSDPFLVLAIALLMAGIAGISAVNRTSRRFPGIYWQSLLSILVAAFIVTNLSVAGIGRCKLLVRMLRHIPNLMNFCQSVGSKKAMAALL